ncbi:MAG: hypothetical protein ACXABG_13700 [Promethearchaeota archaeon]
MSIGFSVIGGSLGVIFGFGMLSLCDIIISIEAMCLNYGTIGIISVLAIIGAVLEFKMLLIGSTISAISGVLELILVAILALNPLFYNPFLYFLSFLLVIAGGVLGFWEFIQSLGNG